jgi:hypothetical protein
MASQNPNSNNVPKAPEDDYIDIIDVLGFLWRAKVFVIIGILVMTLLSVGVVNAKKPPVFVTTLPVSLEVAGGITPDQITANFNGLMTRPDIQKALRSADVGFVGGKPPFKLVSSAGETSLEFSSLSSDPGGERALNAVRALTDAARKLNQTQEDASSAVAPEKKASSDLEDTFRKLVALQVSEEAPYRSRLFALEANLAQKTSIRPIPATFVKGTSLGDDVFRLLGAADSKLTDSEKAEIIKEYSELAGAIRVIEAKYEAPLNQLTSALSGASGVLADLVKGYPVIVVDEAAFKASVSIGAHERYESKRGLFLVLGVMLGGLFGLISYGASQFLVANKERLKAAFRS